MEFFWENRLMCLTDKVSKLHTKCTCLNISIQSVWVSLTLQTHFDAAIK